MQLDIQQSIDILKRTPIVVESMLLHLPDHLIRANEGPETWSPYDVVGHFIICEKTDWMPRMRIILSDAVEKVFGPFDRFAQFNEDQTRPLAVLLDEFKMLRTQNLEEMQAMHIGDEQLSMTALHPALGSVTLSQLIASWTTHDLGHIAQISRVLAKQYTAEVGPWKAYLSILGK